MRLHDATTAAAAPASAAAADADDDVIVDVDVASDVVPKRFHFSHTRMFRKRYGLCYWDNDFPSTLLLSSCLGRCFIRSVSCKIRCQQKRRNCRTDEIRLNKNCSTHSRRSVFYA